MKKYGFSDSKCKYEIDNQIVIVSGEGTWQTAGNLKKFSVTIPYPTGFNVENTFILGGMAWGISIPHTSFDDGPTYSSDYEIFVGSEGIIVNGRHKSVGDETCFVRVAIMKTEINPWENS